MMQDTVRWLEEGKMTNLTPKVKSIANEIDGKYILLIWNILQWLHKNINYLTDVDQKKQFFRKRSANQILLDGFAADCTDMALVFLVLARAKGLPSKYIETFREDWLCSKDMSRIKSHVFAEVYLENGWIVVDPTWGAISIRRDFYFHRFFAEGLDFWDIGMRNISEIKKAAINFKNKFLANQETEK